MQSYIIHIDGDAFFASVYQALHPETKGRPVVIGRERGIATAISYEAKKCGVTRGMLISEIKKIAPQCIIASSDYRLYEIFCKKIVSIASLYSPYVERYSIDEVFIDMTIHNGINNDKIVNVGKKIKLEIERSLNITVSLGIACTKTLAKIASSSSKPSGFIFLHKKNLNEYLSSIDIQDVWGIGRQTSAKLRSMGITTANDFFNENESVLKKYFSKNILEIWHELHGKRIYDLSLGEKTTYKSIQRTQTFTPATSNRFFVRAQLLKHIEEAFSKARRLKYTVGGISIFIKTQEFSYRSVEIPLSEKLAYPFLIRHEIENAFNKIYNSSKKYRASGCTLYNLESEDKEQLGLFNENASLNKKLRSLYGLYDKNLINFGSQLFNETNREAKKFTVPQVDLRK